MITSTANQRVKRLVNLKKKSKAREEEGVFLIEGSRMFKELPPELLKEIYVSEAFYKKQKGTTEAMHEQSGAMMEVLSDQVFQYVADTQTPQGILCVVKQRKDVTLERLITSSHTSPLLLILDNVQDPGNLGTILRTAEGAGVTGVIMSKDCVDIYNPKTIRSTMGSIYRLPVLVCNNVLEAIKQVKQGDIRVYAAHLEGVKAYDEAIYTEPSAFLIGNEGNGLSEEVAAFADMYVKIPMAGEVESLNAAIAAAILMFEAGRQRRYI